ncbi:MAG: hypothetical protein ACLVJH_00660 [Faecalibacterium prausnitzii]
MIAAVSSDFIQSEIALRTVSTQRHHPSRKMVDQGLEQVEQKNKVSQNLHKNRLPFRVTVNIRFAMRFLYNNKSVCHGGAGNACK